MQTPEQFLSSFLKGRAAAYALANEKLAPLHAKCFGEPLLGHAGDFLLRDGSQAAFEEVRSSGDTVTIITREHFEIRDLCLRYHLAKVSEEWRIVRIDRECVLCRGTGQGRSGTVC